MLQEQRLNLALYRDVEIQQQEIIFLERNPYFRPLFFIYPLVADHLKQVL